MNVGDKVIADGKETEITATAFDDVGTKVYMVKGSMKDYYEKELIPIYEKRDEVISCLLEALEITIEEIEEQKKMIELMAFELSTEDENYLYRSIDDIIECFKKKAKGDKQC